MPKLATTLQRAKRLFAKHKKLLRTKQILALGVHPRTLYELRDSGHVIRVARGLYRLAAATPLTNPDWVALTARTPRVVICLISALAYYGLTTQIPRTIDIALSSHAQIPRAGNLPIHVFWFSKRAFRAGVQSLKIDGVPMRIYSQEKTIADCFKYRNKIGLDLAIEALREYKQRTSRPNFTAILKYAKICRVTQVIRPYMEALA